MKQRGYALEGAQPDEVLRPRAADEAQEMTRAATGRALVPWGGGARQHVGYPLKRPFVVVSTENMNALVEHRPADLTVTAQAGMTIAVLQESLRQHNQWLSVDVARPEVQTVGGIIAARANSLRRFGYGSVRDHLLGVTVINAQGERITGGGRVVKNVSGYDLPKLYCGSWGTLGLITEATFKVAPLPEASATVALSLPAGRNSEEALDRLLLSELQFSFLHLLSPAAAQTVLPGEDKGAQVVVAGFDGPAETVNWQTETLGASALPPEDAACVRAALRDFSLLPAPMSAAFHVLSSQVGAFSRMLEWTAERAGLQASVCSDAALGLMHAHFVPPNGEGDSRADWPAFYSDLRDKADRVGGSCVLERLPNVLRAAEVPVWTPVLADFGLMARVKDALDPARLWNPGRFVGGL